MEDTKKSLFSPLGRITVTVLLICLLFVVLYTTGIVTFAPPPAYECAAISSLRTIASAQAIYKAKWDKYATFDELLPTRLLDKKLCKATVPEHARSQYYYVLKVGKDAWSCTAILAKPGEKGRRSFFIDETDEVRCELFESSTDTPASSQSSRLDDWYEKNKDK